MAYSKTLKKLILQIVILLFFTTFSVAQIQLTGIINIYSKCLSFPGNSAIIVPNASVFQPNDTVLIIQMAGAQMDYSNNNNFGNVSNLNNTGNFEFNIIDSINSITNTIFFK